MSQKIVRVSDLLKTIKELGEKPENAHYQPELKELAWILMDYVKISAEARGEVPVVSAMERINGGPQVLNG